MAILKSVKFERENAVAVAVKKYSGSPAEEGSPAAGADGAPADDAAQRTPEVLLAQAQAHVEAMLNQARTQVVSIREEARKAGFAAGYSEATQTVEQELRGQVVSLRQMVDSAVQAHNQFLRQSQNEVGRLAVAIAKKIIGRELSVNPKIVTEIVAQAIKEANITGACRIRVNPADFELLSPAWETIPSLQPSDRKWELLADKKVTRGGCIIEADGGMLDAQIESQLEQVGLALDKLNT